MNKRPHPVSQQTAALSEEARSIRRFVEIGNFWLARKLSKKIIHEPDMKNGDHGAAVFALSVTKPDPKGLLIGLLCMCFTILIAFLVSY
jgi:hypothetical protein